MTTVLNAYSSAYPSITNRIRASVFTQTNPSSLVASIIDTTAGHPIRTYSFPGLPRNNYGFSLDEIDGSGTVINNLALFAVVPGEVDGLLVRGDEQIRVGTTPGIDAGATSFTFDGTETFTGSGIFKPDYRGWQIVPSPISTGGIMIRGVEYSWDKDTGEFNLLQGGDIFAATQYYNIHFDPIQTPQGNSYPSVRDFVVNFIDSDTTLTPDFFGQKLICEPSGDYIKVTLPSILLIPSGRALMVEVGGDHLSCTEFHPFGADVINFLDGSLYALPTESFWIYRFLDVANSKDEWRISEACGNFRNLGQTVSNDDVLVTNAHLLDGESVDKTLYLRIYNKYVLNLPATQVVDYDSWSTGNNKYYFSKANSADPSNLDKFHFPDRRNLFERANNVGKSGDYSDWSVGTHVHKIWGQDNTAPPDGNASNEVANIENAPAGDSPVPPAYFFRLSGKPTTGGAEGYPKHYLINKYILI